MTKIRCGSSLCIHNYKTDDGFCDAEQIDITDVMTTNKFGQKEHYHSCKAYEEDEDAKRIQEIVKKALGLES